MIRQKLPNKPQGQEQFVKKGKGMLRLKSGQVVKENEVFYALPEDIPDAFRDTVSLVSPEPKVQETFQKTGVVEDKTPVYKKVRAARQAGDKKGEVFYNITDKQKKVVNEERLTEKEADDLLKDLNPA